MGYKRNISTNVYRSLLSRSGNQCAFPRCPNELFNMDHKLIANLCHIEPVGVKEVRYNPNLTDEIVNGYDNLIFLCYRHHVETNDEKIFTVPVMKNMKYEHERNYITKPYTINTSHFFQIIKGIEDYWSKVLIANTDEHVIPELRIEIDTQADYKSLKSEVLSSLESLESLIELVRDENESKFWEIFNLGIPNHTNKIRVMMDHAEIKYLEELIKSNPQDQEIKNRLENLRKEFLEQAKNIGVLD